ncbi:DedA family protein [Leifsonia sp. NPDC058292]|uniref:DedA family protein n=1 Tax=Leifsonia sp. NPDC058292 TaxID=3346428 RepID=UPI0036DCAA6D
MNDALTWILDLVQSVDPVLRTAIAGVGILFETSILIGLIVPGDTIVLVASTAVDGTAEYWWLVAVVIAGSLAGESIGFALGRFFGPKIRASRLGRRIGTDNWSKAEAYLQKRGGIAVFLSRFLPVLHSLIPLTVGMSRMRYRTFIVWTAPACVIWAFAYVSVGSLAAGSYRELSRELHWAGYVFVGVIALFIIAAFIVKKVLHTREAKHMDAVETEDAAAHAKAAARSPEPPLHDEV